MKLKLLLVLFPLLLASCSLSTDVDGKSVITVDSQAVVDQLSRKFGDHIAIEILPTK